MSEEQRQRIDYYTDKRNSISEQSNIDIYVDGILLPVWELETLDSLYDGDEAIIRIRCSRPRKTHSYYLGSPGVAAPFLFMGKSEWYGMREAEKATKYSSLSEARAALRVIRDLPIERIGGINIEKMFVIRRTDFSHPFTGEDVGLSPECKWMDEEDKPKKKDYRSPYNTPLSEFIGVDDDDDGW